MHGDGLGMSVGEAVEEHYFSPTNDRSAAGSGANGSPDHGGTRQLPKPLQALWLVGFHSYININIHQWYIYLYIYIYQWR